MKKIVASKVDSDKVAKDVVIDLKKKVKVKFPEKENVIVDFNEKKISVTPWISAPVQSMLIKSYLKNYFDPTVNSVPDCKYDFVDAENELKVSIIGALTNVDLSGDVDLVGMIASGLFEATIAVVSNYDEFKENLYNCVDIVERERELEKSVGGILGGVATKINGLLDKLSSISPDEMKKLVSDSQGLLKGLEQSPASAVFVESSKNKLVQ
jgi:hypothetical protein